MHLWVEAPIHNNHH
jgi:hypothetical protein